MENCIHLEGRTNSFGPTLSWPIKSIDNSKSTQRLKKSFLGLKIISNFYLKNGIKVNLP